MRNIGIYIELLQMKGYKLTHDIYALHDFYRAGDLKKIYMETVRMRDGSKQAAIEGRNVVHTDYQEFSLVFPFKK